MSILGRLKGKGGGYNFPPRPVTVASAGTITIQPNDSVLLLSSSAAISTATTAVFVSPAGILPGRTVTLINVNASDAITLKHTAGASNANGYYTGTADLALGPYDVATIIQATNGAWLLASASNNA